MTAPRGNGALLPASLILVGGGKMGRAMLEGWLKVGLPGASVRVVDPHPSPELVEVGARHGVALSPDGAGWTPPDVLVLAIKPQMLDAAGPELARLVGAQTLVVSVLAGKTVAGLQTACAGAPAVIRAMPNLPASIGHGATGAYASPAVSPGQRAGATALLEANGVVEWVDSEDAIDAVTALSGSGPAYVFLLAECMAEAGVAAGLSPGTAARLARATVSGAGALLASTPREAGALRADVTSPGGTTAAALSVLTGEAGLAGLVVEAVHAAKRRAAELAG